MVNEASRTVMKVFSFCFSLVALTLGLSTSTQAATTWVGGVSPAFDDPTNWDNNVPSAGNVGTINAGATNEPTIDQTTALNDLSIIQNGGFVTATRAGSPNIIEFGNGAAVNYTLNGGTFQVSSGRTLRLDDNSTFTVDGGALTGGGNLNLTDFTSQNMNVLSGSVNVGQISVNRRTSFVVSGGNLTATGLEVADAGLAPNTNYNIEFSGGVSDVGALDIYWATGPRIGQVSINGNAILSASSLTFAEHGTGDEAAQDGTNINFSSTWTGSFEVAGASTLNDYWALFDTNTSTAGTPFIRLDGAVIDQATFNSNFTISGTALSIVPEPGSGLLFLAGLCGLVALRRPRRA